MSLLPQDRVYYHYHHFHNSTTTTTLRSGTTGSVQVTASPEATSRDAGVQVAPSLRDLAAMLQRDGIGQNYSGTFYISDATHKVSKVNVYGWDPASKEPASSTLPGQQLAPSQLKVVVMGSTPPPGTRLTATATDTQKSVQDGLLAHGYTRAAYVAA